MTHWQTIDTLPPHPRIPMDEIIILTWNGVEVLATAQDWDGSLGDMRFTDDAEAWCLIYPSPTHWMPFPEPPLALDAPPR